MADARDAPGEPPAHERPPPDRPYRLCFAGFDGRGVIPLAEACGVGTHGPDPDGRFAKLAAWAAGRVRVVDAPAGADVVVYPHSYRGRRDPAADAAAAQARAAGKPFVAFRPSDDATPARPPHGVVWRDSIEKRDMTSAERAMPALAADLGAFDPAPHEARPRVAFCGYTSTPARRLLYRLTGRRKKVQGLALRVRALRALGAAGAVDTDFLRRADFGGGMHKVPAARREARRARVRGEFYANMADSPYTFCTRGAGNFSYRLYEVLARGRVPLFLDTDAALPFAGEIDYARHMPVATRVADLAAALADWHAGHDAASFARVQRENRALWLNWFEPAAFYARALHRALEPPGL